MAYSYDHIEHGKIRQVAQYYEDGVETFPFHKPIANKLGINFQ